MTLTACKCGCGFDEPIELIRLIAVYCEKENLEVSSVCRCPEHNKAVGGALHSQHMTGKAIDIHMKDDEHLVKLICMFKPHAVIQYAWGYHLDFRPLPIMAGTVNGLVILP